MKKNVHIIALLAFVLLLGACSKEEIGPKGFAFESDGQSILYPDLDVFYNKEGTVTVLAQNEQDSTMLLMTLPKDPVGKWDLSHEDVSLTYFSSDNIYLSEHTDSRLDIDVSTMNTSGNDITRFKATFSGEIYEFISFGTQVKSVSIEKGTINF